MIQADPARTHVPTPFRANARGGERHAQALRIPVPCFPQPLNHTRDVEGKCQKPLPLCSSSLLEASRTPNIETCPARRFS